MPYIKLPMSHQFLTGMVTVVFPSFVGSRWDCVPYTRRHIDQVNSSAPVRKDITRNQWCFDASSHNIFIFKKMPEKDFINRFRRQFIDLSRKLSNPQIRILYNHGHDGAGLLKYKKDFKSLNDHQIKQLQENYFQIMYENYLQQFRNAARDLNLNSDEIKALLAFSMSVGDGVVLQGGTIRGPSEVGFRTMWLMGYSVMVKDFVSGVLRVARLSNNQLGMSHILEIKSVLLKHTEETIAVEDNQLNLIRFYDEQHVEQTIQDGQAVFTLTPYQQTIEIEQAFWKNTLLPLAKQKLEKLTELTSLNIFLLVPFLCDDEFRGQFYFKLAQRPAAEYDLAKRWINICFNKNPELQVDDEKIAQVCARELSKASLQQYNKAIKKIKKFALQPGRLEKIYAHLSYLERSINAIKHGINAVYFAIKRNPWKATAIVTAISLAIVVIVLTVTGVLAPLGVYLGWQNLILAFPAADVAIAGAGAALLGASLVGLVKVSVMLLRGLASCLKRGVQLFQQETRTSSQRQADRLPMLDFIRELNEKEKQQQQQQQQQRPISSNLIDESKQEEEKQHQQEVIISSPRQENGSSQAGAHTSIRALFNELNEQEQQQQAGPIFSQSSSLPSTTVAASSSHAEAANTTTVSSRVRGCSMH